MSTHETEKFYKINLFLDKGCIKLTRALLQKHVADSTPLGHTPNPWPLEDFLQHNQRIIFYLPNGRKRKNLIEEHTQLLVPTFPNTLNIESWNLQLLCFVLLEMCNLSHPAKDDIKELKKIKNYQSHTATSSLTDREYADYSRKIKDIIGRFLIWLNDTNVFMEVSDIIKDIENELPTHLERIVRHSDEWQKSDQATAAAKDSLKLETTAGFATQTFNFKTVMERQQKLMDLYSISQPVQRPDGYQPISGNFGYFPKKVRGHGSQAIVYEGEFGRLDPRPIAVKVVQRSNKEEAVITHEEIVNLYKEINENKCEREIKIMETLNKSSECSNIIRFFDSHIDIEKFCVYLALELAQGTLRDYIEPSNRSWQKKLPVCNIIREIVHGLTYIHAKNIVHRDLKPENIFIVERSNTDMQAVIGDFGSAKATACSMFTLTGKTGSIGYIAPEIWQIWEDESETESLVSRFNRRSDVFSLALVMYFALSMGKHPFGTPVTAQAIFSKRQPNFRHLSCYPNSLAYEVILVRMLSIKPDERPKIEEIIDHPALWSSDRIMQFFVHKSDEFETMIKADPSTDNNIEDLTLITSGNWMNQLPVNIKGYLENFKVNRRSPKLYSGKKTSIRYLLRAVRNTERHYHDYPASAQAELGMFPDGHIALWLGVCPGLLMHVYEKLGS